MDEEPAEAEEPTAEEAPADEPAEDAPADEGSEPEAAAEEPETGAPPSNNFPEFAAPRSSSPEDARYPRREVKRTGQKLLRFDRRLGARFVAGADEAGRGSLAGPLVVAGVLLDYGSLRDHRVRPLGFLNDSKQCSPERREDLFRAVVGCAERVAVRVIPPGEIDRNGLHRSNLAGLRAMLEALTPPAEACLVDGFRLGAGRAGAHRRRRRRREERGDCRGLDRREGDARPPDAPPRRALSRVRLRAARRLHHARPLRGRPRARPVRGAPAELPGALLRGRGGSCLEEAPASPPSGKAVWWYRLRGWKILGENVWAGGNELDLIVRRGRALRFVEVKEKKSARFGDPLEMVTAEKQRRLRRAAEAWLGARPELARLAVGFDVIAVRDGRVQRVPQAF